MNQNCSCPSCAAERSALGWIPAHDKAFLIGQRLIYGRKEIVIFLGWQRGAARAVIRRANGVEQFVDPINLISLPGGQL